jgi:hypothetical protein
MRNKGTGLGITVLMKEVMSSKTWVVGPVSPLSEGFLTERPHPLQLVNNKTGWQTSLSTHLWSNV